VLSPDRSQGHHVHLSAGHRVDRRHLARAVRMLFRSRASWHLDGWLVQYLADGMVHVCIYMHVVQVYPDTLYVIPGNVLIHKHNHTYVQIVRMYLCISTKMSTQGVEKTQDGGSQLNYM
jgi:hypothetical protein